MKTRCEWAGSDSLMTEYHDQEWGVPVHDDQALFELLILEGAQAGLSWQTILRKREGYRRAFDEFDIEKVAAYGQERIETLLQDPGIVRNRRKVEATVLNAWAFVEIQREYNTFDAYVWRFVDGQPVLEQKRLLLPRGADAQAPAEALLVQLGQQGR